MGKSLDKLREITEKLPPFHPQVFASNTHPNIVRYQSGDEGTVIGYGLLKIPSVAVQMSVASKGSFFQDHTHAEIEIVVLYRGKCLFTVNGQEREMIEGDNIRLEPGQVHSVKMLTDCEFIAITIPASEGFPDGI